MIPLYLSLALWFPNFIHQSFFQIREYVVIDNKFALQPFEFDVTQKELIKKYGSEHKKTTESIPRGQGVLGDSIVTLKFDKDSFYFLKKSQTTAFYGATIQAPRTKFVYGLHVGMSKLAVLKVFKKPAVKGDTIVITNSNETCYHYFYFQGSKLVKIKIDGCLD